MPKLNDIKIMGHLARDAELNYTTSGKPVTNFTVAVNREYGDGVDFIDCTAWNRGNYKLAEYTSEYEKGNLVFVAGALYQQNWKDKNDNKRTSHKINVDKAFNFSKKPKQNHNEDDQQTNEIDEDDYDVPF